MNQIKLAREIRKKLALNQEMIENVLIEFQNQLIELLATGHTIHLRRLGTFKIKKLKKAKRGFGMSPEQNVVRFKAGGVLQRVITKGEEIDLRETSDDLEGFREISED